METEIISAVAGVLIPGVVDLLPEKWTHKYDRFPQLVALSLSMIFGLLIVHSTNKGDFGIDYILANVAIIYTASETVYRQAYRNSSVQTRISRRND